MTSRARISSVQKSINFLNNYFNQFNFLGLVFGLAFFSFSVLPSLMPRPWLYQGVISGISILIGYGIGTALSAIFRWMFEWDVSPRIKTIAWRAFAIIGPLVFFIYLYEGTVWQKEVYQLVGEADPDKRFLSRIFLTTLIVFVIFLAISRTIRRLAKFLIRQLDRILPRRVSVGLGSGLVFLLMFWLLTGVAYNFFVFNANNIYKYKNSETPAGVTQPIQPTRSGSPESLIKWNTLGYQGKKFVSGGPSTDQLAALGDTNTKPQIRVYSGLDSAPNPSARAELAVKELERTGAFNRKILVLATTTGTGWLEPQAVDSLEYIYGGDSAIVAQQYSYLPSWISFLVDKQNAQDAGKALYDAVYSEWSKLPQESRPKLIAYGLSLGSFGGQSAYTGVGDIRASIDGTLFVGTPNDTQLWRTVTKDRDPGSPEYLPVYQQGKAVRFAATNKQIEANSNQWQQPKVLYLQHASDPVVWFDFNLWREEPDWLKEPRGPDVSPRTHWYPFVTFVQVAIDQFFGTTVPNGHGHNYGNTMVDAWQAVAPNPDFSAEESATLNEIISNYPND